MSMNSVQSVDSNGSNGSGVKAQAMQQLKLSQGSNGSQQNMVSTFNTLPSNDLSQLINLGSWHPKENTFAVAKHNSLFLFTEKRSSQG